MTFTLAAKTLINFSIKFLGRSRQIVEDNYKYYATSLMAYPTIANLALQDIW